jgi:hypothetical protein
VKQSAAGPRPASAAAGPSTAERQAAPAGSPTAERQAAPAEKAGSARAARATPAGPEVDETATGAGARPSGLTEVARTPAWRGKPWVVAAVVGLLVCGGGAFAASRVISVGGASGAAPVVGVSGSVSGSVGASASAGAGGSRASATPVRADDDLARVCDGWYFPKSPKFAGKAPHQISVGVVDSTALPSRRVRSSVEVPDRKNWRAWVPVNPAKSQLVGCVDLAGVGETVRSCKFDDPGPRTVALKRATYRVRLFETATGRKLLDRAAVGGDDRNCPTVAFLTGGESLVTAVGDKQLYELFRPYVMKV